VRVLLVVHGVPPAALGGTEIYVHDLAQALHRSLGEEVVVLAREADPRRPEHAVRRELRSGVPVVLVNHTFRRARGFQDTYRSAAIGRIAGRLADELKPDVAHVHHLTCLGTDVVTELARRRIPILFTLNDYWLICHRGQLLDRDGRRCEAPGPGACARCVGGPAAAPGRGLGPGVARALRRIAPRLQAVAAAVIGRPGGGGESLDDPAVAARALAARARHMQEVTRRVARFLAPSRTLRERFLRFGIEPSRMTLQEQGIDLRGFQGLDRVPADRLRLGFLGSLMVSKAPHLLLEAFAGLPAGSASVHLHGAYTPYHGDDSYRDRLAPLLERPGVHATGPIPHDQVPRALASLDVLVVPSVWIENAPFVIREAFAAGVPVVASHLGGMAELVRHGENGLLFAPGDAGDLGRALRRLLDEPDLLPRLRRGVGPVKAIEADAAWTRELYRAQARDPAGVP
jgi:glycosyltransferase involved in cell wall biosynthesis